MDIKAYFEGAGTFPYESLRDGMPAFKADIVHPKDDISGMSHLLLHHNGTTLIQVKDFLNVYNIASAERYDVFYASTRTYFTAVKQPLYYVTVQKNKVKLFTFSGNGVTKGTIDSFPMDEFHEFYKGMVKNHCFAYSVLIDAGTNGLKVHNLSYAGDPELLIDADIIEILEFNFEWPLIPGVTAHLDCYAYPTVVPFAKLSYAGHRHQFSLPGDGPVNFYSPIVLDVLPLLVSMDTKQYSNQGNYLSWDIRGLSEKVDIDEEDIFVNLMMGVHNTVSNVFGVSKNRDYFLHLYNAGIFPKDDVLYANVVEPEKIDDSGKSDAEKSFLVAGWKTALRIWNEHQQSFVSSVRAMMPNERVDLLKKMYVSIPEIVARSDDMKIYSNLLGLPVFEKHAFMVRNIAGLPPKMKEFGVHFREPSSLRKLDFNIDDIPASKNTNEFHFLKTPRNQRPHCFMENNEHDSLNTPLNPDFDYLCLAGQSRNYFQYYDNISYHDLANPSRIAVAENKALTLMLAARNGIEIPVTQLYRDINSIKNNVESVETIIGYPFYLKSTVGGAGTGVTRINNREHLMQEIALRESLPFVRSYICQKAIPGADTHCIRVIAWYGEIYCAYARTGGKDGKASIASGGTATRIELTDEQTALVNRIVNMFRCDIVGLDFFVDGDKWLFNEVNPYFAGCTGPQSFGMDYEADFVKATQRMFEKKKQGIPLYTGEYKDIPQDIIIQQLEWAGSHLPLYKMLLLEEKGIPVRTMFAGDTGLGKQCIVKVDGKLTRKASGYTMYQHCEYGYYNVSDNVIFAEIADRTNIIMMNATVQAVDGDIALVTYPFDEAVAKQELLDILNKAMDILSFDKAVFVYDKAEDSVEYRWVLISLDSDKALPATKIGGVC